MVAKGRPVLVLYYPDREDARALAIVAPLTSQVRGQKREVDLGHPSWLPKPSAVNIQGLASVDRHMLTRRFGKLTTDQFNSVKNSLRELLALQAPA
jgi:mRNA-degrading endonuclease toxin of MazEF toxin-antitoxin module